MSVKIVGLIKNKLINSYSSRRFKSERQIRPSRDPRALPVEPPRLRFAYLNEYLQPILSVRTKLNEIPIMFLCISEKSSFAHLFILSFLILVHPRNNI